jgi:FixJ family two-component response regulator
MGPHLNSAPFYQAPPTPGRALVSATGALRSVGAFGAEVAPDDRSNTGRTPSRSADDSRPIVFVVDDDFSVRRSLEHLVGLSGWKAEVFRTPEDFLGRSRVSVPSCVVLDIGFPDLSGLELQTRIAADRKEMSIIFLTGHSDVSVTVRAMKAGARDFLMKPFKDEELLSAIRCALEVSRDRLEYEAESFALTRRHDSLSGREREVMGFVVAGLLNKQIAFELGISEITVKAHRGKVMRKMAARSLADLIAMAARLGLPSTRKSYRLPG